MNLDLSPQEVAFVLPAYNEERDLPALLERISTTMEGQPFSYRIIIVDDGSRDLTPQIAKAAAQYMPIKLIQHEVNGGLGKAMQTGLSAAVRESVDFIVTMDSDNSHDPLYVRNMVDYLNENKSMGMVIASRYRQGSEIKGLAAYRKLLSYGCLFAMKLLVPYSGVRDYSTGFRCYRASTLKRVLLQYGSQMIQESGFVCQLELLLKLRSTKVQAAEIPYILRYDLKEGASKMKIWRTVKRYFAVVGKYYKKLPAQRIRELDTAVMHQSTGGLF
jgi:dolichol-phosphate mannosyltransferase